MKIRILRAKALGISLAGALVAGVFAMAQKGPANGSSGGAEQKLPGTWRGDSLCVEKGTACQDEIAVYRIAAIAGKPGTLLVSGGKVVDGKEIVMGQGARWCAEISTSPFRKTSLEGWRVERRGLRPF